jgi:hypothetical protein
MTITKLFLCACFLLLLNGCVSSPEEIAVRNQCSRENNAYSAGERISNSGYWNCLDRLENAQRRQQQKLQERAQLNDLQNRCEAFGFQQGTTAYSNCLMNQKQQDEQKAYQNRLLREQAAERQRKALRDMNDALKPQWPIEVKVNQ